MTAVIAVILACIAAWVENGFTLGAAIVFALIYIGEEVRKR